MFGEFDEVAWAVQALPTAGSMRQQLTVSDVGK